MFIQETRNTAVQDFVTQEAAEHSGQAGERSEQIDHAGQISGSVEGRTVDEIPRNKVLK